MNEASTEAPNAARMRELGKRGGEASGRARRREPPLDLARVEAELPTLETPEKRRAYLELVTRWGAAGMLQGATLGPLVRAAEVASKDEAVRMDREHIAELEVRVASYEKELAAYRAGGLRVV